MATTSTDGNDTFVGTHTTMTALDTLDGGAGTDTLLYIDDSAAGTPLAVQFSNIETVAVRNLSGDAATTASAETATVGFQALAAGQTVTIAGVTFNAGSSGATAAEVAGAFTTATLQTDASTTAAVVAGGTLTGTTITAVSNATTAAAARVKINETLATNGYTAAAGGQVNSVKFTSNADPLTNVTDLAVTGTAVTGRNQIVEVTVSTKTTDTTDTISFTVNGVTVTTAGAGADTTTAAAAIVAAVNGQLGVTAASNASGKVTISTSDVVSFAGFAGTGAAFSAVTLAQAHMSAAAPTVTIVDGVAAVAASTNALTVDASAFEGVTTIMNTASTDAVTFSGMTEIATLAVEKVTAGALATTTANFDADLTNGTADAVSVSLSGNTSAGTITIGAGFETVNVSSTGTNTVAGLVTGAKTVNITGAGSLKITDTIAGATKIDGSTATGKLTLTSAVAKVDIDTGTGADKVTVNTASEFSVNTGAGNDTVVLGHTTAAGLADNKVTIDGGAGTDTLEITAALGTALSALSAANLAKKGIVNFEKLALSTSMANTSAVDTELLGFNSDVTLKAGVTTAAILNNLANGATITFAAGNAGALTANVKGAADAGRNSDTLNITLAAEQTANTAYGSVVAASIETVNVNSTTGNDAATSFTNSVALTATSAKTVNIAGDAKFSLTTAADANDNFVALEAINASGNTAGVTIDMTSTTAYTKALTITGSATADAIKGGAGNDVVNAGAGNDTVNSSAGVDVITLGAGNDTFVVGVVAHSGVTIATADRITDFSAGTNVIDVSALIAGATAFTFVAQAIVQNAVTLLVNAGTTTFAGILDALAASGGAIGDDKLGVFQFDGNTYVYANTNNTTANVNLADDDVIVRLDGLHTLTADNFVL